MVDWMRIAWPLFALGFTVLGCTHSDRNGEEVTLHLSGSAAPVVPEPARPAAAQPRRIQLSVETEPQGAAVQLDTQSLGVTPISVKEPHSEIASAKLRVTLAGYQPIERIVHFDRDQRITLALAKASHAVAPTPEPAEDYKLDDLQDPYAAEK